jgi:hypothetical protein
VSLTGSTPNPSADSFAVERTRLEVEHLRKEIEKLTLEVEALRSSSLWGRIMGQYLPLITAMLAVAGFLFAIYQYSGQLKENERQLLKEAAKPFWDEQIKLYIKAAQAAATIATYKEGNMKSRAEAEEEFWILYWGPLAAIEDVGTRENKVEKAMINFGRYIRETPHDARDQRTLERLSLDLAHAIRAVVAPSFDLKAAPSSDSTLR